jgi:hypothetical protein
MTQVGGFAIQILDARGGLISKNAKEGNMSTECSLNDHDIRVAHAMGIDPKAVAMIKYKHGKGGLCGIALFSEEKTNPYGAKISPIPPTNPGRLNDKPGAPIRTIIEPEDSDGELVRDPAGLLVKPMRVLFPVAQ